jgi:DnaK suppressor protein
VKNASAAVVKKRLLEELAKLSSQTDDIQALVIEPAADLLEQSEADEEREVVSERIEQHTRMIHEIEGALAKLNTGRYGLCERCGSKIPSTRLKAIPWVQHCVECQRKRESAASRRPRQLKRRASSTPPEVEALIQ